MSLETWLHELDSTDAKTRLRAIYKIGILGDPAALPALTQVTTTDPSVDIRPVAKAAISHIQQTQSMDRQADAQADLRWTKQFLIYLDSTSFQFSSGDVQDLVQQSTRYAEKILAEVLPSLQKTTATTSNLGGIGESLSGLENFGSSLQQGTASGTVGTYQMFWDCAVCGSKKLLGVTHKHCPNCGAAQDPEARYFPNPGEEIALENHIFVGKDRICPACEGLNSANAHFCGNCGADLATAAEASTREDQVEGVGEGFTENKRDLVAERYQADVAMAQQMSSLSQAKPKVLGMFKSWRTPLIGGTSILALIVSGIAFLFLYQRPEDVTVTAHHWQRVIEIEEYGPVEETRDCVDMPSGAYDVNRRMVTRTRQVPDGQTCRQECTNRRVDQGDGSFRTERDCRDVCTTKYRTESYQVQVCDYTIDKWRVTREVKAGGNDLNPYWPEYSLASASNNRGHDEERAGDRKEEYILEFKRENGKKAECKFDKTDTWLKYSDGETIILEFNLVGQPNCSGLENN